MKILDGNYKKVMVTNQVMIRIEENLRDYIIDKIENCNFIFSDGNKRLFEQWINELNLNELSNLKSYGEYFGYNKLATIINTAINEYSEEY